MRDPSLKEVLDRIVGAMRFKYLGDAPEQFKSRYVLKPFRSHSGLLGGVFGCVLEDLHRF